MYERLLTEKDRQIEILADQIDHLRLQVGTPNWAKREALNPSSQPEYSSQLPPYVSEEEEDIRELAARQVLSPQDAEDALARVFSSVYVD